MTDASEGRAGHLIDLLRQRLGPHLLLKAEAGPHEDSVTVHRRHLRTLLSFTRRDPDADQTLLVDMFCIDHHTESDDDSDAAAPDRFEVIYRTRSPRLGYRLCVSVYLPGEDPTLPTTTSVYPAANWYERELWDAYGVYVDGHPYLRRLLLYPGFSGHPQRRDYPLGKCQPLVPLREAVVPPETVSPAPPAVVDEAVADNAATAAAPTEGER